MARTGDPTRHRQFFINVADNGFLNHTSPPQRLGYAVFGKVVKGTEAVDAIRKCPQAAAVS